MSILNSAVRGLTPRKKVLEARMRRVSLGTVVYLIWEERNKRIFDNTCHPVDVIFLKFQVIFYMILQFHEQNHFSLNVGWIIFVLCDVWSLSLLILLLPWMVQSCVLGHCCYKVSFVAQVSMKASGEFFLERALNQLICFSDLLVIWRDMWQWYWHVLYLQCFAIINGGSAFLVIGYLLMQDYCAGDLFCYILIFPCSRGLLLHSMVHCFAKSRLERESVVFLSLWPWCLLLSFFLTVRFENMLFSSCPASYRYRQLSWDPWLLLVWMPSRCPL